MDCFQILVSNSTCAATTGDEIYRNWAWDIFEPMDKHYTTAGPYYAILMWGGKWGSGFARVNRRSLI